MRVHGMLVCMACQRMQEVEMGTGSVALDVVYQNLAKAKLEEGTQVSVAWGCCLSARLVQSCSARSVARTVVVAAV
jgi:hypothetical protein